MSLTIDQLRGSIGGQRRLAIVDMAAFVILAIAAGVTSGLALMGAVILLSGDVHVDSPVSPGTAVTDSAGVEAVAEARVVNPVCSAAVATVSRTTGRTI